MDGGDWTFVNANLWTSDGDLNTRVVGRIFGLADIRDVAPKGMCAVRLGETRTLPS